MSKEIMAPGRIGPITAVPRQRRTDILVRVETSLPKSLTEGFGISPRAQHKDSLTQMLWNESLNLGVPIKFVVEVYQKHHEPILITYHFRDVDGCEEVKHLIPTTRHPEHFHLPNLVDIQLKASSQLSIGVVFWKDE